jgi:hypothetical protein
MRIERDSHQERVGEALLKIDAVPATPNPT